MFLSNGVVLKGKVLIFSLRYNIGLKKELKYLSEILNADLFVDNRYELIENKSKKLSSYSYYIFYNSSFKNIYYLIHAKAKNVQTFYCFHEPYYTVREILKWKKDWYKYLFVNILHFICSRLADNSFVFSNYGFYKLKKLYKNSIVYKLSLPISAELKYISKLPPKPVVLFVGRINNFKNPNKFLDSYIKYRLYQQFDFIILSSTYVDSFLENPYVNYKYVKNLSDEEIEQEISSSSIVISTHDYCTQSGILPIAFKYSKPALINISQNYEHEPSIDFVCGRIVDFTDASLPIALEDIINNYSSYSHNARVYFLENLNILNYIK